MEWGPNNPRVPRVTCMVTRATGAYEHFELAVLFEKYTLPEVVVVVVLVLSISGFTVDVNL